MELVGVALLKEERFQILRKQYLVDTCKVGRLSIDEPPVARENKYHQQLLP